MTPANATGAQLAKAGPRQDHTETDIASIAERSAADKAAQKRAAGLQARLAIRGHQLHALANGTFIVSRWNLTRDLSDLDAVEAFAAQVAA